MSKDVLTPLLPTTPDVETRGETFLGQSTTSDQVVRRNGANSASLRGTTASSKQTRRHSGGNVNPGQMRPPAVVSQHSTGLAFIVVCAVFVVSVLLIFYVYSNFPHLDDAEMKNIKLPRNIEDAKVLGSILSRYKERYYLAVLSGVFIVYLFLQTFAIPGSIFLSILSGFLFPFLTALLLICFCSATGATFCYGLSFLVGKPLILKYFPEKVRLWSDTVHRHRDTLLNYIIFLRITPFLPNWFINIASPVIGVPLFEFWLGTFLGVGPPSFVAIQAGTTLSKLTSSSDALSWTSLAVLIVLGLISLIPVLFKNFIKKRFE